MRNLIVIVISTPDVRLAIYLMSLLMLASCGGHDRISPDALFVSGDTEVYADSMVRGGRTFVPDRVVSDMTLRSDSRMADALTSSAIADTALTPLSIWMSGAMLDPEASMQVLRRLTDNGRVRRQGYPLAYPIPEWGAAAWEIYCVTGSDEWLREAYNIIMATLRAEETTGLWLEGLVCGSDSRLEKIYPEWMTVADRAQSMSLYVNVFHWRTLDVAAQMAEILGLGAAETLRLEAKQARSAINNRLWIPQASRYGSMLYGMPCPIAAQTSDCGANAACALLAISIPEMSSALVSSLPVGAGGVPDFYPLPDGTPRYSPDTQALMAMAAAKTGNGRMFCNTVGALWAMSDTADVSGPWTSVLLRSMLGLRPVPGGIEVSPFIPDKFKGSRRLSSLTYRDATLDISIHGTGDRRASFSIDSVASDPFIPGTLSGPHSIEIVMASNMLPESGEMSADDKALHRLPAMPETRKTAPGLLAVTHPEPDVRYGLYDDGTLGRITDNSVFDIPADGSVLTVTSIDKDGIEGLSAAPVFDTKKLITVNATSITPRRPPLNLIKDRETATRYIELAPRHNTRLTFYVNIPEAGRYFVRIVCSNGSANTAVRTLGIIDTSGTDRPVGLLASPAVREADWISTAPSTWAEADLTEGPNRLSLTYVTGTVLLNRIELLRKQ